jgi:hypothetical protein
VSEVGQEETIREVRGGCAAGRARLLVDDRGLRVVPLPAAGAPVVGRGDDADVQVADHRMSRRHVRLHVGASPGPDALAVEDLRARAAAQLVAEGMRDPLRFTATLLPVAGAPPPPGSPPG